MYCDNLLCAEIHPCRLHTYQYEIESINTIWSGFTENSSECDENCSCSHFRQYEEAQDGLIFKSQTIQFSDESGFWFDGILCLLCNHEIEEPDELVVNLKDDCQFHKHCLNRLIRCKFFTNCPGCKQDFCKACWKCSY